MNCLICGKEFQGRGQTRYCSKECRLIARDTKFGRERVQVSNNQKNMEKFRRFLAKRG